MDQEMKDVEITVREYNPDTDDGYIYSTWTQYAWYSPKDPILLTQKQFFKEKNDNIKQILSEGKVKIACLKDDPYVILGYMVVHNDKMEWCCIKKDFRKEGIESLLRNSFRGELLENNSADL